MAWWQVRRGARRLILGLKVETELSSHWAIEVDALHREWKRTERGEFSPGFLLADGIRLTTFGPSTRVLSSWQFPVLPKYRFGLGGVGSFVEAGPSFRTAGSGSGLNHFGATAGAGIEVVAAGFRIAPTVRYTRWSSKNWVDFGGAKRDQVEVLVAFDRPSTAMGVSAFGRRLSVGAIAGVGLGRDFNPRIDCCERPERNSAIWGVMLEAALWRGLSVEVDGLYRPLHGWGQEFERQVRFAHLTWEFPVLAKWRFAEWGRVKPFVAGGPSFRAEGNLNLKSVSHFGGTVGGGVETRLGWLKIAPQVRYTRWGEGEGRDRNETWRNQTQLLVSFAF